MSTPTKKETQYIVLCDSPVQSIISNLIDLGSVVVVVWFNFNYCGNSLLINLIALLSFLSLSFSLANSRSRRFNSKADLEKFAKTL